MNKLRLLKQKLTLFFIAIVMLLGAFSGVANAATQTELQAKINDLQTQIATNNAKVKELASQADSLKNAIAELDIQIDQANNEINKTSLKIAELEDKLVKTQAELDRQKDLLKDSIRALYKKGGASTVELLIGSDSFSQFIDSQEYLNRLKSAIQESTNKVIGLKLDIQSQQQEQEALLKQQQDQKNIVESIRVNRQTLLNQTQGDENRYKAIVDQQKKDWAATQAALDKLLTSYHFVSQGYINAGEQIGRMGSTGASTGPHTHFAVKKNDVWQNPQAGPNTLAFGLQWPVGGNDTGWDHISQYYGCTDETLEPYDASCPQRHFHYGLDIWGAAGTPVLAAAGGDIMYRGCGTAIGIGGLGFLAIIQHPNGLVTFYPHMITDSGQTYGYCN